MTDVCLVYLPYGALERPSLALSVLKSGLVEAGIDCRLLYTTFSFAERIGRVAYADMVWVRSEMVGEWTFAGAAFPDFQPDHDEYMRRINASYAPDSPRKAAANEEFFWNLRHEAEAFIEETAREVVALRPRIVACSSTFNQHCAALALARQLKQLDPSIITILGGGNCEGEMGLATIREFPDVDFVASGEAEDFFPTLCRKLLARGADLSLDELPYGVFGPRHRAQPDPFPDMSAVPRAKVKNLDACPVPDFSDYFAALERFQERQYVTPGLLIETSRGCWWGMVNHCTFCGLNGGGIDYRSKSPERAVSEFRQLARQYGVRRFLVVDNILDRQYFKNVLPALATGPERFHLFYEIKANVTFEQLAILRDAGATWLQPGIESLHDDALALMKKGTRAWVNVQLLKWARQLGLSIGWNMLCGFPGEADDWYAQIAGWIPLIEHLEPCTELRPIRFDRFSPYQVHPEAHGLNLQPAWPYRFIYPLEQEALAHLVYGFEDRDRPPQYTNPLRLSKEEFPSLGGPGRDLLQRRIRAWHKAFLSPVPPVLCMTEREHETEILDTRSVAPQMKVILTGIDHRVHRVCHAAVSLAQIENALGSDGCGLVGPEAVRATLDGLARRKLIVELGNRYLALALPGEVPSLPRSHREGYPGGWVWRPPRKKRAIHRLRETRVVGTPTAKSRVSACGAVRSASFRESLHLDGGGTLANYTIAYETHGVLTEGRDNAVLVCHPLTKDAHIAGCTSLFDDEPGWWDSVVGPDRALDTRRYFVICSSVLGGGGGSTGPSSPRPETGEAYGMHFPIVTVSDIVRAQKRLIEYLDIEQLHGVIGGCFGGQQALKWAIQHPEATRNVTVIGTTASTSAHTIAIFNVMRRLIRADPDWKGGDYYGRSFPQQGLAHALVAAVPLWMSRQAMEKKFGRRRAANSYNYSFDSEFAVEMYLDEIARRAKSRNDPNALLYLTKAMEYFDLEEEYGSLNAALASIQARMLFISYRSDWRYPPEEIHRMHVSLAERGADSRHVVLENPLGHGTFLFEPDDCACQIAAFLAESPTRPHWFRADHNSTARRAASGVDVLI